MTSHQIFNKIFHMKIKQKITVNVKIIKMNSLFHLLLSFYCLDYLFLYLNVKNKFL